MYALVVSYSIDDSLFVLTKYAMANKNPNINIIIPKLVKLNYFRNLTKYKKMLQIKNKNYFNNIFNIYKSFIK